MVSAILVGVMRFLTLVALFLLESPGQIEPLAKLSYKKPLIKTQLHLV